MQVGKDRLLHQLGVQRGHAIDAVAARKGQVRHAHPPLAALVDQADRGNGAVVDALQATRLAQQLGVDRIDQLHVARQQPLEQVQRPALQRLGQEGVVGIAEGAPGNIPRLVETQIVMIDQQPHQFGDRHRRMGVVQLDRRLVGQGANVLEILDMPPDDVLERGGGEEIFLPQPQLLARGRAVRRIEDADQRLRRQLSGQRAGIVARIEPIEPDGVDRLCGPQAQRVDPLAAPADHGGVDRDRLDRLGGFPVDRAALGADHLAAEADEIGALAPLEFPGIAMAQPGFGQLDLPAIVDPLAEHAVHIADAIAIGGQVEAGEAFHETRRQPPQAAIAQRRVGFDLFQFGKIDAQRLERARHLRHHPHVRQCVAQQAPDQELQAEIIDPLGARRMRLAGGGHPALDDVVADGQDGRGQPVVASRIGGVLADPVHQRVNNGVGQRPGVVDMQGGDGGRH